MDDVKRYTDIEDSLDILERMLEWGHIAPTAPDTLSEYNIVSGHSEYRIAWVHSEYSIVTVHSTALLQYTVT